MNYQSNIPQFFLLAYTPILLLPSLCISGDLPTQTHHRQFSFAFCVSNSIIMFFGEVEVGVCETMNRTATMVFWVGGPRSYPEAGHFLWNLETDFVWIWEFLCSAATIGIKLNLISISLYKIWNWFVDVACLAESKSPEMQRETRGRGRGKEGKGETCNEILVLLYVHIIDL